MQKKIEKTKNLEFHRKSKGIKLNESLCTRNMASIVVVYGADEHLLQKNKIKKGRDPWRVRTRAADN